MTQEPIRSPHHPLRRARLTKKILTGLTGSLDEPDHDLVVSATSLASEADLRAWAYKALYLRTWESIISHEPLLGVNIIPFDDLVASAIASPLSTWCIRLYYEPKHDDEWDTNILLREAPWLRDCFEVVSTLVRELQDHRTAVVSCETEDLARGLFAASRPISRRRIRRLFVQLYNERGLAIASC